MKWTSEMVFDLRAGVASRKSYGLIAIEIAEKHHIPVSRNAVIGKANRLGLEPAKGGILPVMTISTHRRIMALPQPSPPPPSPPPSPPSPSPPPPPPVPVPVPVPSPPPTPPVDIFRLRSDQCAWVIAGVGLHSEFCGRSVKSGSRSRYCDEHHSRVWKNANYNYRDD